MVTIPHDAMFPPGDAPHVAGTEILRALRWRGVHSN